MSSNQPSQEQTKLVEALLNEASYPHAVGEIRHLETHVSHLILTGEYAYKIKKPLDLGFLDFSTLEKRRFYCEEELRLNRRLAPDIYLYVVTINGSASTPRINGAGPVLEYAVRMKQFDADATLDRLDEKGGLQAMHIDAIARAMADFHAAIPSAPPDGEWGSDKAVWQPIDQNFEQIAGQAGGNAEAMSLLQTIQRWSENEHGRLQPVIAERQQQGFVRECHGDLHLGNMAWQDGKLLIFDCLEFNADLRWVDVMSEAAFFYMDLLRRGRNELAIRFINRYLEQTGDYAGMRLMRYYAVYRAMVRAKVAFIRAGQGGQDAQQAQAEGLAAMRLAVAIMQTAKPMLVITHGLSGSGKTTFSQKLIEKTGSIALRSDIERKRLAGLSALEKSGSGMEEGIYTRDFSRLTYERMAELAETLLLSGWSSLADATFIARWQRELFQKLAQRCAVPFRIMDFDVPAEELRRRVQARSQAGMDASEADVTVLERQLETHEPLFDVERTAAVSVTNISETVSLLETASG